MRIWLVGWLLPGLAAASNLSWQACVERAAQSNAEIQSAQASLQASGYQAQGARGAYLPQLSGNLGYTYGNGSATAAGANAEGNATAGLTLSQNLFAGWRDQAKLEQARAGAAAAEANLRLVKAKVSYALKGAFEGLRSAQESERLARDIQSRREANLRLVELRFESGRENKGSLLLSQAYLEQARYDVLQARHARDVARTSLAKELGADDLPAEDIEGDIPTQEPSPTEPDFRALAAQAPDRDQANAQERAARAAIAAARAGFLPSLNLTGAVNEQGARFFPRETNRWSLGVGLTVPLFNGGQDYYATRSAAASWTAAVHDRDNVDRQLLAKLKQSYSSYAEAAAKLQVDGKFLAAAVARAEIARSKYDNGLLSFEDWDAIENDLITRQKAYVQAKRDRVVNEAAWEAQGKGALP